MKYNFDPMTGEPINNDDEQIYDNAEPEITGYDPMTGEPVYGSAEPEITGYDPMTGEPVYDNYSEQEVTGYDPMTGEPVYDNNPEMDVKPKKGKAGKIVIGVAAAAVVVGVTVFAGVKSGAFLSKSNKVLLAVANTAADSSHLTKDLQSFDILNSKSFTTSLDAEVKDYVVKGSIAMDKSRIQMVLDEDTVDSITGVSGIGGVLDIDKEEVKLSIPAVSDKVFTYNYKEKKNGYIAEEAEEELEMVDQMLSTVFDDKNRDEINKKFTKAMMKTWNDLKFEKAGKETFEVDGKDRKCKGYQVEITEDTLMDFMDNLEEVAAEYSGELYGEYVAEPFDDMRDDFDGMEDIDLSFYVYKNKLACIRMETDDLGKAVDICFLGGDTRWQNMELRVDDEEVLRVEGETNGSEEAMELRVENEKVAELVYDYKKGDFSVSFYDGYSDFGVEGKFATGRKGIEFTIDDITVDGENYGDEFAMTLNIEKGAAFEKLKGEAFDIGQASEDDIYDLAEDFEDFMY